MKDMKTRIRIRHNSDAGNKLYIKLWLHFLLFNIWIKLKWKITRKCLEIVLVTEWSYIKNGLISRNIIWSDVFYTVREYI